MRLGRKLLAIGGLILLLLIPLALLDGLVDERQQRAAEVVADIAQASANAQRVTAPLLRLEIERVVRRMERVGSDERAPSQPVDYTEVETLLGDPTKAKEKMGWVPQITIQEMISEMVAFDFDEARKHALLKDKGYNVSVSRE